jgi:hypothetical protein
MRRSELFTGYPAGTEAAAFESDRGGETMGKEPLKEPYVTPEVTTEKLQDVMVAYGGGCGCGGSEPGSIL